MWSAILLPRPGAGIARRLQRLRVGALLARNTARCANQERRRVLSLRHCCTCRGACTATSVQAEAAATADSPCCGAVAQCSETPPTAAPSGRRRRCLHRRSVAAAVGLVRRVRCGLSSGNCESATIAGAIAACAACACTAGPGQRPVLVSGSSTDAGSHNILAQLCKHLIEDSIILPSHAVQTALRCSTSQQLARLRI